MVRRKKTKFKCAYIYFAGIIFFIFYLSFSRSGRFFVSWVKYKIYANEVQLKKISNLDVYIPDEYNVFGIDVSHYQKKIDWLRVADFKSGRFAVDFVFIKATEGQALLDPAFNYNWQKSLQFGIIRGAYHYYKPNIDANSQANNFCKNVNISKGDLPPVLDVEEFRGNKEKFIRDIALWLKVVESYYGVKPIVYTGAAFYEKYLKNTEIENYKLWVAHYYEKKPATFAKWYFWQFNDKARIDGIEGFVDINAFCCDSLYLQSILKR